MYNDSHYPRPCHRPHYRTLHSQIMEEMNQQNIKEQIMIPPINSYRLQLAESRMNKREIVSPTTAFLLSVSSLFKTLKSEYSLTIYEFNYVKKKTIYEFNHNLF